jgi:hypothetical protein
LRKTDESYGAQGDGYFHNILQYADGWGMEIVEGSLEKGSGINGWSNGNGSSLEHIDFFY